MKYETIITHCTGRVETLKADNSADALASFQNSRDVPFYTQGFMQAVSETGSRVTMQRFKH